MILNPNAFHSTTEDLLLTDMHKCHWIVSLITFKIL